MGAAWRIRSCASLSSHLQLIKYILGPFGKGIQAGGSGLGHSIGFGEGGIGQGLKEGRGHALLAGPRPTEASSRQTRDSRIRKYWKARVKKGIAARTGSGAERHCRVMSEAIGSTATAGCPCRLSGPSFKDATSSVQGVRDSRVPGGTIE